VPIRTHRGRAAVYRRFWGWPVRSPRHLMGTVLVVVAIAIGAGLALPDDHRGGAARNLPSRGSQVGTGAAPGPALADSVRTSRAPVPSAPAAALDVARSWVQAFLTVPKGITAAQWVAQLQPFTTEDFLPQLSSIDPANVPAAQITEAPRTVSVSGGSAEVDVPTTTVVVRLLLVSTPAGWRVASYERAG
jgi:hypothetical protein